MEAGKVLSWLIRHQLTSSNSDNDEKNKKNDIAFKKTIASEGFLRISKKNSRVYSGSNKRFSKSLEFVKPCLQKNFSFRKNFFMVGFWSEEGRERGKLPPDGDQDSNHLSGNDAFVTFVTAWANFHNWLSFTSAHQKFSFTRPSLLLVALAYILTDFVS